MRIGGDKKHGRYNLGDGLINATSNPSLSQIRAQSMGASIPIRPRPSPALAEVEALNVTPVPFVVH
jgi:hypothetical protein